MCNLRNVVLFLYRQLSKKVLSPNTDHLTHKQVTRFTDMASIPSNENNNVTKTRIKQQAKQLYRSTLKEPGPGREAQETSFKEVSNHRGLLHPAACSHQVGTVSWVNSGRCLQA